MKTKTYKLRTILFIVIANLILSMPIIAQVKTSTIKTQVKQIKKEETAKPGIKEVSATKERLIAKLPVVGDFAQGGIVFWVDETGKNGLVCAIKDQVSEGIVWYAGTNSYTAANDDGPYAGKANTARIIEVQGTGGDTQAYAALVCNELQVTEGGKTYDDWYLPSKQELNLMYLNRATINAKATANNGFAFRGSPSTYWSSTESNNGSVWGTTFVNGDQYIIQKNNKYRVRAIRAFHF